MKLPRRLPAEAIAKKTLHVTDFQQLAREIAAYLMEENRVAELEPLLRDVMAYRARHGKLEVSVVSAHELTDTVLKDVRAILKEHYPRAESIHLSHELVPEMVGGVRLIMPDEQLDLSLRSKLSNFKHLTMNGKE